MDFETASKFAINNNSVSENPDPYSVWSICEEITSKENWYSKVFNDDIVAKWRDELPDCVEGTFEFVLRILRTTAQGSIIKENECTWNDDVVMCNECRDELKEIILNNPETVGLSSTDVDEDFFEDGWEMDFYDWAEENCNHPRCTCISPDSSLDSYIEYYSNGVLDKDLHNECKNVIRQMELEETIDWHPGSDQQVRDIIHPSMYCYVKGISIDNDGYKEQECEEDVRYQWLPSEFTINNLGNVKVSTYINNLNMKKYPHFIPLIERIFGRFLDPLESVLNRSLKNLSLQVIVKVGSIILDCNKPKYGGSSWHTEGMPYEHIVATCIHYVDVDNITDSYLEFRKPVVLNADTVHYPQNDDKFTSHHYGIENHFDGVMNRYLGLVRCHEGASVIFPNTLQHRVKDFSIKSESVTKSAKRTILAFFIIDPNHRIISTDRIPPQQNIFTTQEANYYRNRLMIYRKFFVNSLNKEIYMRHYSLCEH